MIKWSKALFHQINASFEYCPVKSIAQCPHISLFSFPPMTVPGEQLPVGSGQSDSSERRYFPFIFPNTAEHKTYMITTINNTFWMIIKGL